MKEKASGEVQQYEKQKKEVEKENKNKKNLKKEKQKLKKMKKICEVFSPLVQCGLYKYFLKLLVWACNYMEIVIYTL